MSDGPLIVQSDRTVLLEVAHPAAEDARHDLAVFAELERAPEHIHTYRITRLGLWNARAAGHTAEDMLATLEKYSRSSRSRRPSRSTSPRPWPVTAGSSSSATRDGALTLTATDAAVLSEITRAAQGRRAAVREARSTDATWSQAWARGQLKQELLKLGWPAEDLAGYTPGTPHPIALDGRRLGPAGLPEQGGRQLLRARFGRRRAALWRGQDARRRGRDGDGEDDHADPGHQHGLGPPVARRAAQAHNPHRG